MNRIICIMLSLLFVLGSIGEYKVFAEAPIDGEWEEGQKSHIDLEMKMQLEAETGLEREVRPEEEPEIPKGNEAQPGIGMEAEPGEVIGQDIGTEAGKDAATASDPEEAAELGETVHVLIVGNSFSRHTTESVTYSVEKPLEELAAGEGKSLEVTTLAHGSAKLRYYAGMNEDYLTYHKQLVTLLVNGQWDYVIFQEHSTAPMVYFESSTYPAVQSLLRLVTLYQPEAKPLLYMTPGYNNGTSVKIGGVSRVLTTPEFELYLAAAYHTLENKLGVGVIPMGMHALRANMLYPQIQTVGPDLKHPSYAGYYLAACSFYQKIFGSVPDPKKASLTNCDLTEESLELLAGLTGDSMEISQKNITLAVGEAAGLSVVYNSHLNMPGVTYQSFNTKVATVDPKTGKVVATGGGSTAIVAMAEDGLQAFCNIMVKIPISFARSNYLAGIGDVVQILPSTNAQNLAWSSSKASVATVDAEGRVTAKAAGRAVITVINQEDSSDRASYEFYVAYGAPTGLAAVSSGNPEENAKMGNIKVSWKAVSGAGGYDVYRATGANGTYQLIGSSSKNSYIDKAAAVNKVYYYKVTAKNAYVHCTSPLSVRTRGIILKALSLNAGIASKKYVKLTWKKNSKATGYVIYRSAKKNSGYKKIATLAKTKAAYTDKTVQSGKTYYYRIKAYRELDGKVFYGVKSLRAKIKVP